MSHSRIITYIQTHPITWHDDLKARGIRTTTDGNLCIFNYGVNCDFSDKIVQEARGIIIDMQNMQVVCWPFRKFGNWNEPYADQIRWETAHVQEKLDGSIIKLWFNKETGLWQFSTNSVINAINAPYTGSNPDVRSFRTLIAKADNYDDLLIAMDRGIINEGFTYIFELTSPYQQIVVPYEITTLWHIGTRSNETGEEINQNIGIHKPKEYPIHSFKQCLSAAKALNRADSGIVQQEGFVVVDDRWNRIKVKSPEYLSLHYLLGNGAISKDRALDMIEQGLEEEVSKYPQINAIVKWYEYQIAELEYKVSKYIAYVRGMYEEVEHDRKAVALAIKDDELSPYGFAAIGNDRTAKEIIRMMLRSSWVKYIKEYQGAAE